MKNLLIITGLLCSALFVSAQGSASKDVECATITTPEELKAVYEFVRRPMAAQKTTAVDTIPLSIHIVGQDDGTGYYPLDNLFTLICELNDHYAPASFYFTIKWPINYIDNSNYYEHNSRDGSAMMRLNNIANTVNIYFVQDPAGACGYYSPGGRALAMKKSCALPKSTTLTHEIGHYFGLPHTFYGWEGSDPNNPPGFSTELVTRGAGSNCATHGDGFCDTPADFLSGRWTCPYNGSVTDDYGDPYQPDGTLYMSYSDNTCRSRFSPQQIAFMQNRLHTTYSSYLVAPAPPYVQFSTPTIVYPEDKIHDNYRKVIWNKVPGAESYYVAVKSGAFTPLETVTSDTVVDIDGALYENRPYTITIAPMNGVNICGDVTTQKVAAFTLETTTLSVTDFAANRSLMMSPNPANTEVRISLAGFTNGSYVLAMTSTDGKSVYRQTLQHNNGKNVFTIPVRELAAGMYFLRIAGEGAIVTEKLMVQH